MLLAVHELLEYALRGCLPGKHQDAAEMASGNVWICIVFASVPRFLMTVDVEKRIDSPNWPTW